MMQDCTVSQGTTGTSTTTITTTTNLWSVTTTTITTTTMTTTTTTPSPCCMNTGRKRRSALGHTSDNLDLTFNPNKTTQLEDDLKKSRDETRSIRIKIIACLGA